MLCGNVLNVGWLVKKCLEWEVKNRSQIGPYVQICVFQYQHKARQFKDEV